MGIKTVARRVPQTIEAADRVVVEIGLLDKEIEDTNLTIKVLGDQLKKAKAAKERLEKNRQRKEALVGTFADAHRDELTDGRRVKHFRFPSGGEAQWRFPARPQLVVTGKLAAIIRALKKRPDWEIFVQVTETLKKDALKSHPEVVARLRGVRIDDSEYFTVKP